MSKHHLRIGSEFETDVKIRIQPEGPDPQHCYRVPVLTHSEKERPEIHIEGPVSNPRNRTHQSSSYWNPRLLFRRLSADGWGIGSSSAPQPSRASSWSQTGGALHGRPPPPSATSPPRPQSGWCSWRLAPPQWAGPASHSPSSCVQELMTGAGERYEQFMQGNLKTDRVF